VWLCSPISSLRLQNVQHATGCERVLVFLGADSDTVLTAASSTPEMKGVGASEILVQFVNRLCTECRVEVMCTSGDLHFSVRLKMVALVSHISVHVG
jgi:hypothetical protein